MNNDRLRNLVEFVIHDQLIMELNDEETNNDLITALKDIASSENYIDEIIDWVETHEEYLDDPDNCLDPKYYEMITDGIYIIYLEEFTESDDGGYAFECENKYLVDYEAEEEE